MSEQHNQSQKKLKDFNIYILNSIKFYSLKNEGFTQVIFTIMLVVSFVSAFIPLPASKSDMRYVFLNLAGLFAIHLASTIYLAAYIRDLRGKEYSLRSCTESILRRIFPVIGVFIAYFGIIIVGFILFLVPGIIFAVMFLFGICYVIDLGESVTGSMSASRKLTQGLKRRIFGIMFIFNVILFLPVLLIIMSVDTSRNILVQGFVMAFVKCIITLMQQRLVAQMYVDLEYGTEEENPL